VTTRWERVGGTTRWGRYLSSHEEAALRWADEFAGPRGCALDIGCEGGRWARLLTERGWEMTCTDTDREALEVCAARLPSARCIVVDPDRPELPVPDDSQGLVSCIEVHPVAMSEWFPAEVSRVLRPGGVLVTVAWNRASLRGIVADLLERRRNGRRHPFYGRTYRAWRRDLLAHDFRILRAQGLAWAPFSRTSNSPAVPIATAVERALGLRRLPVLSPWVLVVAQYRPAAP
jgi:SAM-dependent methyltransferase